MFDSDGVDDGLLVGEETVQPADGNTCGLCDTTGRDLIQRLGGEKFGGGAKDLLHRFGASLLDGRSSGAVYGRRRHGCFIDSMPLRMVKSEREFAFAKHASTYLADVDRGFLCGEAEACRAQAISACADAGAAVSL